MYMQNTLILTGWGWKEYAVAAAIALKSLGGRRAQYHANDIKEVAIRRRQTMNLILLRLLGRLRPLGRLRHRPFGLSSHSGPSSLSNPRSPGNLGNLSNPSSPRCLSDLALSPLFWQ